MSDFLYKPTQNQSIGIVVGLAFLGAAFFVLVANCSDIQASILGVIGVSIIGFNVVPETKELKYKVFKATLFSLVYLFTGYTYFFYAFCLLS